MDLINESLTIYPHESYDDTGKFVDTTNINSLPIAEITIEKVNISNRSNDNGDNDDMVRINTIDLPETTSSIDSIDENVMEQSSIYPSWYSACTKEECKPINECPSVQVMKL